MDRDAQPSALLMFAVKTISFTLLALNVSMHGAIALFIGGPFGLAGYLCVVAALWGGAWVALRRSHQMSLQDPADPAAPGGGT